MLKIHNFECLICGSIYEDPVKLPCGFISCRKHFDLASCEEVEILCLKCNKLHKRKEFLSSKIFDTYQEHFKINNDLESRQLFIDSLRYLRNLRWKAKLNFNIKTNDYQNLKDLVSQEKEQALAHLKHELNQYKDIYLKSTETIKTFSTILINILNQEYKRNMNDIQSKKIVNPRLNKEFDDLIKYFTTGPRIINKTNYKEFVSKYIKLDLIMSKIFDDRYLCDYIRKFFYEINEEIDSSYFSLLMETLKIEELTQEELNGMIFYHHNFDVIKMRFKIFSIINPLKLTENNLKQITLGDKFDIIVEYFIKYKNLKGYFDFRIKINPVLDANNNKISKIHFLELKLKNEQEGRFDHRKAKFPKQNNQTEFYFKNFVTIDELSKKGLLTEHDDIILELLIQS
ncbi:unnamed protein product [Brachionus calyciflorus]|uniref:Uncharacterized protein n=1 Tax=Brachionus calyciflorus TaxID=104777 RepID=A0A813TVE2_9BILA|nr:unnamed protein product [Brachionus calyciflorus]